MKAKFFKHRIEGKEIKNNFFINEPPKADEHEVDEYKEFYLEATRWK